MIRNLIGDREDRFFATVFLGSGFLFVAMMFVAAGVGGGLVAAVRIQDEPVPSLETVGIIRSLSFAFVRVYAVRMAAVLSYLELLILVFPAWVAAVSVVILRVGRGVSSRAAR